MLGNMEFLQSSLKILIDFGTGNAHRYIDVSQIYSKMGPLLCSSLPGFHATTGCDYNPAFFRKGNKRPFERLLQCEEWQRALTTIGNVDIDACESVFDILEGFVCRLYSIKKTKKVNEGRYEIFLKTYDVANAAASFKLSPYNFDASNLPPCHVELTEHLLRTWYITKIWKNTHEKNPVGCLELNNCGWVLKDDQLNFRWFKGEQLPQFCSDVLLEVEDPENQSDEEGDMDESADINDPQGFSDASNDDDS